MKLLVFLPRLGLAGPERALSNLSCELARRGWDVTVAVMSGGGELEEITARSCAVVHVDGSQRFPLASLARVSWRFRPKFVLATGRLITPFGIVRKFLPKGTILILRPANDLVMNRTDVGKRSWRHRIFLMLERAALRKADGLVAQSKSIEDELRIMGSEGQIVRISNPVEIPVRERLASRELRGQPALIAVGRLSQQKGFDLLVTALPFLASDFPKMHVHFFGNGPEQDHLEVMARQLEIDSMVTFRGFSSHVHEYMISADLLVAPSRYEGFSNTVLEAQALGLPAVITLCPGNSADVLSVTSGGVVAPPDDPETLAIAIRTALQQRNFDTAAISAIARKNWSSASIGDQYEAFFLTLLRNSGTA